MTFLAGPRSSAPLSINVANSLRTGGSTLFLGSTIHRTIFVYSSLNAMATETGTSSIGEGRFSNGGFGKIRPSFSPGD